MSGPELTAEARAVNEMVAAFNLQTVLKPMVAAIRRIASPSDFTLLGYSTDFDLAGHLGIDTRTKLGRETLDYITTAGIIEPTDYRLFAKVPQDRNVAIAVAGFKGLLPTLGMDFLTLDPMYGHLEGAEAYRMARPYGCLSIGLRLKPPKEDAWDPTELYVDVAWRDHMDRGLDRTAPKVKIFQQAHTAFQRELRRMEPPDRIRRREVLEFMAHEIGERAMSIPSDVAQRVMGAFASHFRET